MHINVYIKKKQNMKDTIGTIVTGVTGVGAVQLADNIPTSDDIQNYGQLIIQIVIGILTILKMFKKKKNGLSDSITNETDSQ